ncbi:MAG: hypothetical protein KKE37_12080 [Verrucomicrobia bacterium]|nr:hypothetical protein [Verrucomicrobiota bacterium]MBU4290026.1 hypothetical protein [Verrucomicrobiota bacterium]MBU4430074.1 hypothetical protein [Verrucomicrobiota bacterium]MCG2679603.1 hypothetical protein [Kiritimatiellia bacterium]
MKSWSMLAAIGVMAGLVGLVACGGENKSGSSEQQTAAPLPVKAAKETVAANSTPAEVMAGKKDAPAGGVQQPAPFSAEMSADFLRKVMETSARIEAAKTQIAERQKVIFETNPEAKACRVQLVEMQSEINKIMDADAELVELKLNRDILWTTMPTLPRGNAQGGGPVRGFGPMR